MRDEDITDPQAAERSAMRRALAELRKQEVRDATKGAIKELLGEYAREWGMFSLKTLAVAAGGAMLYAILWAQGWRLGP